MCLVTVYCTPCHMCDDVAAKARKMDTTLCGENPTYFTLLSSMVAYVTCSLIKQIVQLRF
jgi:hypothetical protein